MVIIRRSILFTDPPGPAARLARPLAAAAAVMLACAFAGGALSQAWAGSHGQAAASKPKSAVAARSGERGRLARQVAALTAARRSDRSRIAALEAALAQLRKAGRPAAGQAPGYPAQAVALRHASASSVAAGLRRPDGRLREGIVAVEPDDAAGSLLVVGTPQGIAAARQIIGLLDVAPRRIRLSMRVLHTVAGSPAVTTVCASPTVVAASGALASVSMGDDALRFRVEVQPRLNGDGTVSCASTLRVLPGTGPNQLEVSATTTRRVAAGSAALHAWVPDPAAWDAQSQERTHTSAVPRTAQDWPGYFLEIAPVVEE